MTLYFMTDLATHHSFPIPAAGASRRNRSTHSASSSTFVKLHLEGAELAALKGAPKHAVVVPADRGGHRLSQCRWHLGNPTLAHGNIARLSISCSAPIPGAAPVPSSIACQKSGARNDEWKTTGSRLKIFGSVSPKTSTSAGKDRAFLDLSNTWNQTAIRHGYFQNFTWLGRPVIQSPQDLYAIQELIWACRPELVIETGIARGGSLVMSASMLVLMDYCDAVEAGSVLDPNAGRRRVVGIDIEIRAHNRGAIDAHPTAQQDPSSLRAPQSRATPSTRSPPTPRATSVSWCSWIPTTPTIMSSKNSSCTRRMSAKALIASSWIPEFEDLPEEMCADRPWGKGNNPKTAVWEYMKRLKSEGREARDGTCATIRIRSHDRAQAYDHRFTRRISEAR